MPLRSSIPVTRRSGSRTQPRRKQPAAAVRQGQLDRGADRRQSGRPRGSGGAAPSAAPRAAGRWRWAVRADGRSSAATARWGAPDGEVSAPDEDARIAGSPASSGAKRERQGRLDPVAGAWRPAVARPSSTSVSSAGWGKRRRRRPSSRCQSPGAAAGRPRATRRARPAQRLHAGAAIPHRSRASTRQVRRFALITLGEQQWRDGADEEAEQCRPFGRDRQQHRRGGRGPACGSAATRPSSRNNPADGTGLQQPAAIAATKIRRGLRCRRAGVPPSAAAGPRHRPSPLWTRSAVPRRSRYRGARVGLQPRSAIHGRGRGPDGVRRRSAGERRSGPKPGRIRRSSRIGRGARAGRPRRCPLKRIVSVAEGDGGGRAGAGDVGGKIGRPGDVAGR